MGNQMVGGVMLLTVLFSIILLIVWVLLPFLIMGVNRRLDTLIRIMQTGDMSNLAEEDKARVKSSVTADAEMMKRSKKQTLVAVGVLAGMVALAFVLSLVFG